MWKTYADLQRPIRNDFPTTADFMLADGIWAILENADDNFLAKEPDVEFVNPKAFLDAYTVYAQTLLQNTFPVRYAPTGWDPVAAARTAVEACCKTLNELPVNAGDPKTVSVLIAWVMGTGQFYGGHAPTPVTQDTSLHPETGASAGPGGILGGGVQS